MSARADTWVGPYFDWIAREIGAPLSQVFRHLDERGAAASLGQVHRGELLDGRAVAVKIKCPGVRDGLDTDLAFLNRLSAPLLDTYVAIGFNQRLLEPIAGRLRAVTAVLFEPFSVSRPRDLREWRLAERLADVLGDDRWNFRFAGPASLLFLIRAFQGLVTYVGGLGARIDWRGELLAIPRRAAPPPGQPRDERAAPPTIPGDLTTMAATTLRLRVLRGGEQTVQFSFVATAAGHQEDLIPQELVGSLRDRGIDLRRLADDVIAGGYQPCDLFTLEEDGKTVRVWIE